MYDVPVAAVGVVWCPVFLRKIFRVSIAGVIKETTYASLEGFRIDVSGVMFLRCLVPQFSLQDVITTTRVRLGHFPGIDTHYFPRLDTSRCENPQT